MPGRLGGSSVGLRLAPTLTGGIEPLNARFLMPPQRPVILDAELCEHARGKPVRVPLAGHGKLNDLLPDQLGHLIVRAHGELERDAHSLEGPVHGLDVLGLESESTGSGPYHHGAADGLELGRPHRSSLRYTSLPTKPADKTVTDTKN